MGGSPRGSIKGSLNGFWRAAASGSNMAGCRFVCSNIKNITSSLVSSAGAGCIVTVAAGPVLAFPAIDLCANCSQTLLTPSAGRRAAHVVRVIEDG